MREILFRGLHRRKGEKVKLNGMPVEGMWVYGGYCQYNAERGIIYQKEPFNKFSVYADSVGQYTSLTDKNGKMIFEGDILDASWALVGLVVIRFGRYKDVFNTGARGEYGHIGFYAECPHDEWVRKDICYFNSKSEIVGNIHDNPELIETN